MIPTGTICYVIRTGPGNEHLLGRVVEVIGPALPVPERGGAVLHLIDAPWAQQEHPRTHLYARPSCLLPIAGPATPPAKRRRPLPELA